MKILVGGVPLGRNNIGDEAILACVVQILRDELPGVQLTVSTDDPATAERLGVEVCPLFGFDVVPYSAESMREVFSQQNIYVWAGATGLSDYPDRACELLAAAREAGCRRIVWNVGMNSELNPAKYRISGKKLALASAADRLTGGLFKVRASIESSMEARAREGLRRELESCSLIVTRDPESARELEGCGLDSDRIVVGADSALLQPDSSWPLAVVSAEDTARLEKPGIKRVALCVSAQREITRWNELVEALNQILETPDVELVGLPMNPITDLALLKKLQAAVSRPEAFQVVAGVTEPADITALARRMDVIISSRLHLLILGSIHHVPLIGISRGSKVDNFLAPFGLQAVGSVESCDFPALVEETRRLLNARAEFEEISKNVREQLLARLATARTQLRAVLHRVPP
ncbi:MAG: polysaccharide pyruvyl transferase family protein [Terrimicrobiaceae bacterium]